jgi:hypothetical protein
VRDLVDISFQLFPIILFCILMSVVYLILSIFIKKRSIILVTIGVLTIGSLVFINLTKYSSFLELYSDQLNEDSVVQSVTITVYDDSESIPDFKKSITIGDAEIMKRIIDELSGVELKKEKNIPHQFRDYYINIVVTNRIEKDHFRTTSIGFDIDINHLNQYRIINETEHLKTIQSLVKDIK